MAKPELGTKRIDPETGRKFYDLNRDPIVSPYTGKSYDLPTYTATTALSDTGKAIKTQNDAAELNMAVIMSRRLTLTGSTLRPRSDAFKTLLAGEIERNAWPLFTDGTLRPVMDQTFPLAEAAAAHARMEAGEHIGKIVLEVAGG